MAERYDRPEVSERAMRLLKFLESQADVDKMVRPGSGLNYETVPQRWAEAEVKNPPAGVELGGVFEANVGDFDELVSELVLKRRLQWNSRTGFIVLGPV